MSAVDVDALESRLLAWGAWLGSGGRGEGFPRTNILHKNWLPPAAGSRPGVVVAGSANTQEREVQAAVGQLSVRLANALVLHYVYRMPVPEAALRQECALATAYARVEEGRRRLRVALGV